ncbi:unnamed protein product [Haemonchus placei]|uniref:HTH_48 domain-containing protein n=1 Tax=Haemonchus placei TaxID=6290 RepID=A0A0N4WW35_HAEPC|nr:unnamed protein product [Haemonchus placei]
MFDTSSSTSGAAAPEQRQPPFATSTLYGEGDTTTITVVHCWFARFKKGGSEGKPRSERSLAVGVSIVLDEIKKDLEINTRSLATRLACAQSTVAGHLQTLGYGKVLARWIPHALTENVRYTRVSIRQSTSQWVLEDLVTGDLILLHTFLQTIFLDAELDSEFQLSPWMRTISVLAEHSNIATETCESPASLALHNAINRESKKQGEMAGNSV